MEMEIDVNPTVSSQQNLELNLWYLNGKEALTRKNVVLDFQEINLASIKEFALKENESYASSIGDIEIIHRGKILRSDDDVKKISSRTVLNVIKKRTKKLASSPGSTANSVSKELITQVAIALRTAFFSPNFMPALNKLGESDKMENIFAIAPGLEDDPIGIAIIQDPAVLFHLSDFESLKKLAATRPWVVEALNFITATIHHEKGSSGSVPLHPRFHPIFEGDDEDMDDGDDDGAVGGPRAGPSGSPMRLITREQLAAALNSSLNSLAGLGMPAAGSSFSQGATATLRDLVGQRSAAPTGGASNAASNVLPPGPASHLQNLLPASSSSTAPGSSPVLTTELVARAMNEALRNLPPEQRAEQFNAIRNLATQLQQSSSSNNTGAMPPPPSAAMAQASTNSSNTNGAAGYQEQLAQMREVGITDERLSIMALRVSDGDVATAIELMFSGWQGEGADPQV